MGCLEILISMCESCEWWQYFFCNVFVCRTWSYDVLNCWWLWRSTVTTVWR